MQLNLQVLNNAASFLRTRWPNARPFCGIILGSGWSKLSQLFKIRDSVPYVKVPGLGDTSVEGHSGTLHLANYEDTELLVFVGRRHWYEGAGWTPVALPIFVLKAFQARIIILTNAAGAVNKDFRAGDIMLIEDHINLMGANPLVGPHLDFFGPRFPDLGNAYDKELSAQFESIAHSKGIELQRGVFVGASGPSYETPAEVRAFRSLGGAAVGMSTVPEALLAHAAGLRVLGISCIANAALDAGSSALSHEEILGVTRKAVSGIEAVIREFLTHSSACEPKDP